MRVSGLVLVCLTAWTAAQDCGPKGGNKSCVVGKCCSQYGWCDTTPAHCDPKNCLKEFSGEGSSCAKLIASSTLKTSTIKTSIKPAATFTNQVPNIDVCGHAQGGVSCPGAGLNGYFYRCCSSAGHCGPKNDIQDQSIYCGAGCQAGFGKCDGETKPKSPGGVAGTAGEGETCGPIVNRKCGEGMCCSGSNFCGKGEDFCGQANWCQEKWGECK